MKITPAIQSLIDQALAEDLGERGDITALAIRPRPYKAKATITAKKLAGLPAVQLLQQYFILCNPGLKFNSSSVMDFRSRPAHPS